MNKAVLTPQTQNASLTPASLIPPRQGILQRKCACGSHTNTGGECKECAAKKGVLQRKLTIGASNDPLEQEADRVADQVMSAPLNSAINRTPPKIQRFTRQASDGLNTAPASVEQVLASPGRPLEPALRQDMELRFGYDFSRVRVHTGSEAERSTRDVNAHAYTVGHKVVLGTDIFTLGSHEEKRLIAHELTHVVQQQNNNSLIQRYPVNEQNSEVSDPIVSEGKQDSITLWSPNKAPSCDDICGEKCIQGPGEHCTDENEKVVFGAWKKAADETVETINHLNNTPTSSSALQTLKDNFAWDGKTPADLPQKVADKLQEGLDKMSENLCTKCVQACPPEGVAQIARARGQNCLGHNCFVLCPAFFSQTNKSHVLLHELLHRVVGNKAKMDLYRGHGGYPGGTLIALTMPDPYASVVDDLANIKTQPRNRHSSKD